jgi:diacylglycerol kinase family enzyme
VAGVLRGRARRWHLSSEQRVPYQLDGDYAGRLPVEIQVLPQRVTLRLPSIQGRDT